MATRIEWTDETWNPVSGCATVSRGCDHCYARRMARRLHGRFGYPDKDPFRLTLHPTRLSEPLHWRRPRRVFVCSMGDLFHPGVPDDFLIHVWYRMRDAERHVFQVLTKRPGRLLAFQRGTVDYPFWPLPNVWLGVSIEDQRAADHRIPYLLSVPAAVRFVSAEPLLGAVDLRPWVGGADGPPDPDDRGGSRCVRCGEPIFPEDTEPHQCPPGFGPGLEWIIAGGETGPGARPTHPVWFRQLRDQAAAAGVPFFFKSWGEWTPYEGVALSDPHRPVPKRVLVGMDGEVLDAHTGNIKPDPVTSRQAVAWLIGRKRTGRKLDGQTWDQRPEISHERC